METNIKFPLRGFMLLPSGALEGYHGVDRHPFEPALIDNEIDPEFQSPKDESCIWVFYPAGWRREAYRLYEENMIKGYEDNMLYLLYSHSAAFEIQRIIEPHLGPHEIVECEIWGLDSLNSIPILNEEKQPNFMGYDVAYFGGDNYSAILNGLFCTPHPELIAEFKQFLNEFGLFASTKPVLKYIRRFKELVLSEADSEFGIFRLSRRKNEGQTYKIHFTK